MQRRSFLRISAGAAGGACVQAVQGETADLALVNGAVTTMSDRLPAAEALAVRGGRILAVGSNQQIRALVSSRTQVVDLGGKGVSPGLIDAHSHLLGFGHMQLRFVVVRPPKVHSFDTLNQELARAAANKPAGEWIVARGFKDFKEGRYPRRQDLDQGCPNHPVLAIDWGGQFGVANTLALKKAGLLSAGAKDPYGGLYTRDRRTGIPDGLLVHYPAIYSVYAPELDESGQDECVEWAQRQFTAAGVTCVHDNFLVLRHAAAYVRLEKKGRLQCRVRVYPYVPGLEQCRQALQRLRRYSTHLVRLQGIKLAVDGYALMYEVPAEHRHMAIPMHPQPVFEQIISAIHQAGFQADVHAVGDKGVDWTLAAFAKAAGTPAECRRMRHRIEHFPLRKLDTIRRAAELGVPVCSQPLYVEVKAEDYRERFTGKNREYVSTLCPLRTFAKEGVRVCYGADVPAFPSHLPLDSIRCAMERKTEKGRQLAGEEKVTFLEALRQHTIESAYAASDEKELGSLEPGKLADFVIWNTALAGITRPADLAALKVLATYIGGQAVYNG